MSDCTFNLNNKRRPVKAEEREQMQGIYPYYGATGIIDYVNDYLIDGEFVLISEDGKNLVGRYKKIAFIASGKLWVNNHAHVLQGNKNCNNVYLEFYLNKIDLNPFITGIDQFKLNRNNLDIIPLVLPPVKLQNEFEKLFRIIDKQKIIAIKEKENSDIFFQTLLQKAFKGELVLEVKNDK